MWPLDIIEWSWLHNGRQMQSWGSIDFGYASSGLGAGQCRWAIISGSIYVHGVGAALGSDSEEDLGFFDEEL
jgi:hypothetical protein